MVGDTCLGSDNTSSVQANSKAIRPCPYRNRLGERVVMSVKCPVCSQSPEVASITHKLYIHDCPVAERRMYTNAITWSDSPNNIQGAKR